MSDLNMMERTRLEQALGMASGYVGAFSNRTFAEFFIEHVGIDIDNSKYFRQGQSKARRMREFWRVEPNHVVARLLDALHTHWELVRDHSTPEEAPAILRDAAARLRLASPLSEVEEALALGDDADFDTLATAIRDAVDKGKPEAALDRLHTYATKYFRTLCTSRGLDFTRETPLHSLVGGYVKALRAQGHIETEMTDRILRTSISVLDAFNDVRNEYSLAHPNAVLKRSEAALVVAHVSATIRFVKSLEERVTTEPDEPRLADDGDLPF